MPRRKGLKTPAGLVGASLSLAGTACAQTGPADAAPVPEAAQMRPFDLHEEELIDVTLAKFYVFDRENPGGHRADSAPTRVAYCRGCGGCYGCRSCRCYYCRSCRCTRA